MLSAETQRLFARLYLEGLSSGDFEPAFRELLGEYATLSSSTVLRLKDEWATEYAAWRVRPLTARYAYIWADGIYLGAGIELENSCLLVVVGAREDGRKELLAMELGYRESASSWASVLRGMRDRGLQAPLLACGDGALGLWAGLDEVFPTTRHQRCWNHRVLNVLDKVPKRLWPETRRRLLPMVQAGRPVVPDKVEWIASEYLKTRVATGYCSRHLTAQACPYANICETCDNFVPAPAFVPALQDQLVDIRELQADARRRGWTSEVERHGRVIDSLEGHLERLENAADSGNVLDTPPMAG